MSLVSTVPALMVELEASCDPAAKVISEAKVAALLIWVLPPMVEPLASEDVLPIVDPAVSVVSEVDVAAPPPLTTKLAPT